MTTQTSAPTDDNKITVGDQTFDVGTLIGGLNYIKAMDAITNGVMHADIRDILANQALLKWTDERVCETMKERIRANVKAIVKDATKIDHVARFIETTIFKFNDKKIEYEKIANMIDGYIKALNVGITAYNAANESANLEPYRLAGGKPKGKAGGKGHGRNYRVLGELLIKHVDLWQGKPQIIEYGARSLAYPVHVDGDQVSIMYTGISAEQFIDTRDKDTKKDESSVGKLARDAKGEILGRWKKCDLVNGKLYAIGMINQLNTWANGAAIVDGVNKPTAAPNSWMTCALDGLTIPDGMHKTNVIKNPSLADYYDQYKPLDQESDENDDQDGETDSE